MGVVCLWIDFNVVVHSYSCLRLRLSAFQMERANFYRFLKSASATRQFRYRRTLPEWCQPLMGRRRALQIWTHSSEYRKEKPGSTHVDASSYIGIYRGVYWRGRRIGTVDDVVGPPHWCSRWRDFYPLLIHGAQLGTYDNRGFPWRGGAWWPGQPTSGRAIIRVSFPDIEFLSSRWVDVESLTDTDDCFEVFNTFSSLPYFHCHASHTIDYRCNDGRFRLSNHHCQMSSSNPNLSKPRSRTASSNFWNYGIKNYQCLHAVEFMHHAGAN
jgi:hypothetical protein